MRSEGGDDYQEHGVQNAAVVAASLAKAVELCQGEFAASISFLLSRMVPSVLGGSIIDETAVVVQQLIPGLNLPEWIAIPQEGEPHKRVGREGWKKYWDASPNQLDRVIDAFTNDINGRIVNRGKFILLRDTALEAGCDPDMPVSTVLGNDDDSTQRGEAPDVRPSP